MAENAVMTQRGEHAERAQGELELGLAAVTLTGKQAAQKRPSPSEGPA